MIVDSKGNNKEVIIFSETVLDVVFSWSPSGDKIAYGAVSNEGDMDIFIANPDGSEVQNITQNPMDDIIPSWSPDGKWIAFHSNRDHSQGIYIIEIESRKTIKVIDGLVSPIRPLWSP